MALLSGKSSKFKLRLMIIEKSRLDMFTFVASLMFMLLWATDQMWEQSALAAGALFFLALRLRREKRLKR